MTEVVLDIRPDERFSRHSEGAFYQMSDGRLLFVFTRFYADPDDDGASELVYTLSENQGQNWSEIKTLLRAESVGARNVMSVSMLPMKNGDIGIFYIAKIEPSHCRIMLSRYKESDLELISHTVCSTREAPNNLVLNNDRVIRLSNGRILVPLAFHRRVIHDNKPTYDSRGLTVLYYSDDDGTTWNAMPQTIQAPFTCSMSGLQEPGIVELRNGVLWAYHRTDKFCQYESFSLDAGENWTTPQPSFFSSPLSPMQVKRNPFNGDLLVVWNPIPNYNGRNALFVGKAWIGGRNPLVWAQSKDDGKTWSEPVVIEGDKKRGFCYPAIHFVDKNHMLLAYCSGGEEDGSCLKRLTISRVEI